MQYQCCFCGHAILAKQARVEVSVALAAPGATQELFCHSACLADALHPSVPIAHTEAGQIMMPLADEGVAVWRPVAARKVGPKRYEVSDVGGVPEDEKWTFQPGTTVICELRTYSDGTVHLTAVAQAP